MSWALWCGWCWLALFLYQSPAPYFSGKNSILHQESDSTNVNLFIFRINYSAELRAHKLNMIAKRQMHSYLAYAIAATILTCIICLVIFVLRKRIRLVIQLFKEAGKALIDMPLLLVEPILVSIIGPYIFYKHTDYLKRVLYFTDRHLSHWLRWCHFGCTLPFGLKALAFWWPKIMRAPNLSKTIRW